MRIVCISDTHLRPLADIPEGDVLVHAGDLTMMGEMSEIKRANEQLASLSHKHKIVIAGNHDWGFLHKPAEAREAMTAARYLQDEAVEIGGLVFYGSPWQPWFCDWAFNLERGDEISEKWQLIPKGIDILITHGPPLGFGDMTTRGERVGCADLLARVKEVRPKLHVFGHIHEGRGVYEEDGIKFVNASLCNRKYEAIQAPVIIDL